MAKYIIVIIVTQFENVIHLLKIRECETVSWIYIRVYPKISGLIPNEINKK
jgi:hypothetical protein